MNSQVNLDSTITDSKRITIAKIDLRQRYLYNNNQDTLFFPTSNRLESGCSCESFEIIDSIQIDGIGAKELVFHHQCVQDVVFYQQSYAHHSHDKFRTYEIWNLDTKKRLFEAKHFSRFSNTTPSLPRKRHNKRYKKKTGFYAYHFDIHSDGKIIIKNLHGKSKVQSDLTTGVYLFQNGQYQKQ